MDARGNSYPSMLRSNINHHDGVCMNDLTKEELEDLLKEKQEELDEVDLICYELESLVEFYEIELDALRGLSPEPNLSLH